MKRSLYTKILLGYLAFGLVCIAAIACLSSNLTLQYLEETYGRTLYHQASRIAYDYRSFYTGNSTESSTMISQLHSLASYLDSSIWLVKKDGTIIYDSDNDFTDIVIENYNPLADIEKNYSTGDFYHLFNEDHITVSAPVSANFKTYGYVVLHQPLSSLIMVRNRILDIIYLTFFIIFGLSLFLLFLLRTIIFIPLKKITAGANEFAGGNLKYEININSQDEMGYLAATLNYMSSELNNMEEYQRKFISNVSHDFRSPLTSIKGYLEAIIDGTIPPEMQEKYIKIVISETERLTKLTASTLTLQSLDKKELFLEWATFDINHVIKDTAAAFEGICRQKQLMIDLVFSSKSMMVYADISKIQQVLYNLIDNAIKFSHPDSSIVVETYDRHDKVFISVKDSGIGIPKDSIKKIWNRFYKTDLSRGKDKKGTGLGLSIVKEIITAHNEHIDVISTEGVGSEFIFTLPRR